MAKTKIAQLEDRGIRAVKRAIGILRAFSASDPDLSVTDLSRKLDLHKSTVHRLLATLEHEGFVLRDPGTAVTTWGCRSWSWEAS